MALPLIRPQPLVRIPEPFNDPEWIFELKLDGFRALAYIEDCQCRRRNCYSDDAYSRGQVRHASNFIRRNEGIFPRSGGVMS